jgi:hypothetical protein
MTAPRPPFDRLVLSVWGVLGTLAVAELVAAIVGVLCLTGALG